MAGRMTKVPLIYCGRRNRNEKLCHLFIDAAGEEYFFNRIKSVYIGYSYYAEKSKDEVQIMVKPKEVDEQEEQHPNSDEWRAKQAVAVERHRKKILRGAIDRNKFLMEDVVKIRAFVKGLSHGEVREFVDWLVDEIFREQWAKERAEMNARLNRAVKRAFKRGVKK